MGAAQADLSDLTRCRDPLSLLFILLSGKSIKILCPPAFPISRPPLRNLVARGPVEPDARVQSAGSRESLDGGLSCDGSRSIDTGVSWLDHRQGFIEYAKRYNPETAKGMVNYLDRYVTVVRSPTDIIRVFNGLSAGRQHQLNRALRALFNYAEIMGSRKDWLDPLRKAIPKDKIGIDLRIPSEDENQGGSLQDHRTPSEIPSSVESLLGQRHPPDRGNPPDQ